MGRHFEGPHLQQAQPAGGSLRRIELVDAKFAAVGIARGIDQEVAQRPVHEPGRRNAGGTAGGGHPPLQFVERNLDLVHLIVARLVDARRLAGGTDEEAAEEIAQGGMVVPVGHQAREQVRPAQEGTVGGRGAAQHEMVATARARVPTVQHELLGGEPRLMSGLVEKFGVIDQFTPVVRRVDIDLDHAGVRGDLQQLETGIAWWRIALQDYLHVQLGGGRLDGRD